MILSRQSYLWTRIFPVQQEERIFLTLLTIFSNWINWTGKSWLDAQQTGLHLCLAENRDSWPMWKLCLPTPPLCIASFIDLPFAKVLPPNMLSCLQRVIKIVNFVKSSALNIRLFKRLCDDLSSDHTCLLYYTEVRWLSRGNATRRLFELLQFCKKNHDFQTDLESKEYILRLAY